MRERPFLPTHYSYHSYPTMMPYLHVIPLDMHHSLLIVIAAIHEPHIRLSMTTSLYFVSTPFGTFTILHFSTFTYIFLILCRRPLVTTEHTHRIHTHIVYTHMRHTRIPPFYPLLSLPSLTRHCLLSHLLHCLDIETHHYQSLLLIRDKIQIIVLTCNNLSLT